MAINASPEIRRVPVKSLKPAPYNPRRIDPAAMAGLEKSLERFGVVEPIIFNQRSGFVVGGHQRLKVLRSNKVPETDVIVVDLDDTDEKALNLALNNPAISGEFSDKLADLLAEVHRDNAALFLDLRLDVLLGQAGPIPLGTDDPDDIPPLPKVPITQPGDLWELGNHRLICGDSSDPATVTRLLDGQKINLAITSPPYASQRKYDEGSGFKPISRDQYVQWFDPFATQVRDNLAADGSFFLNIKENADDGELVTYVMELVLDLKKRLGFRYVDQFVWTHEGTPKAAQQRFKNGFEPVFQFTIGRPHKFRPHEVRHESSDLPDWAGAHPSQLDGRTYTAEVERRLDKQRTGDDVAQGRTVTRVSGLAYPTNVLNIHKNTERLDHGAVFPVALPEFFIRAYSDRNDIIFDPFSGSGTVLIASQRNDRVARAIEISPAYCDVIVQRWTSLTGGTAVRNGNPA